jgi:lipoyl synthase
MQLASGDPLAHSALRPPERHELRQRYDRMLPPRNAGLAEKRAIISRFSAHLWPSWFHRSGCVWVPTLRQLERRYASAVATRSRSNPGGGDVLRILGPDVQPHRARKPPWFKVPAPGGTRYRELQSLIQSENLHTVCQEAACPNIGECWQRGTATFMILGDTCTRRCGFCNVKTGKPTWNDPLEPARVARSVARMGLRHAVITSVDRDDLADYGAQAFVGVIRQIRRQAPRCKVEVLTPDFRGEEMPLAKVIAEGPDVFNHNVEVVPRLYPVARRGSRFERSCRVLRNAKEMGGDEIVTKSGLMVGLGESHDEMVEALGALREHHVQVLTIGQYLRPTENHLPVVRYWHPDEFVRLERAAYALGFEHVAAGPLVRSSYHADQHIAQGEPGVGPLAEVAAS